jgi:copper homeostasis protein
MIAMARPRSGDFCYTESEFRVLRRDIDYALGHGADGVAFGALTPDRRVDARRCRAVARGAGPELVFHRAFDGVRNPPEALEQLIDLGVRRIMTSGGRPTAADGAARIRRLIELAAGRIEILPAGGIRPANARSIISQTGCDQLHTSLRDRTGRMDVRWLAAMADRLNA